MMKYNVNAMKFNVNDIEWDIIFVNDNDIELTRSDGSKTVGVTDRNTHTVYLSNLLYGKFLEKVICHELCHAFCLSYDLFFTVDEEEKIADFLATYGRDIFATADYILCKLVKIA